jgi:uncharacterized membrane-anchored protein
MVQNTPLFYGQSDLMMYICIISLSSIVSGGYVPLLVRRQISARQLDQSTKTALIRQNTLRLSIAYAIVIALVFLVAFLLMSLINSKLLALAFIGAIAIGVSAFVGWWAGYGLMWLYRRFR